MTSPPASPRLPAPHGGGGPESLSDRPGPSRDSESCLGLRCAASKPVAASESANRPCMSCRGVPSSLPGSRSGLGPGPSPPQPSKRAWKLQVAPRPPRPRPSGPSAAVPGRPQQPHTSARRAARPWAVSARAASGCAASPRAAARRPPPPASSRFRPHPGPRPPAGAAPCGAVLVRCKEPPEGRPGKRCGNLAFLHLPRSAAKPSSRRRDARDP